jgi:hypothetical protein
MQNYVTRLEGINRKIELIPLKAPFVPVAGDTTTEPTVFVLHSSADLDVISTVRQAFEDLPIKAIFHEKSLPGGPPAREIAQDIGKSKAVLVFFTSNSTIGDTRDWIVFELGIAMAKDRKIHSWKDDLVHVSLLPRFTEQITTHKPFEVRTVRGSHKLQGEVKEVAKKLV